MKTEIKSEYVVLQIWRDGWHDTAHGSPWNESNIAHWAKKCGEFRLRWRVIDPSGVVIAGEGAE